MIAMMIMMMIGITMIAEVPPGFKVIDKTEALHQNARLKGSECYLYVWGVGCRDFPRVHAMELHQATAQYYAIHLTHVSLILVGLRQKM